MSDFLYTDIYQKYIICKHILLITFLNEPKHILLHTVKCFGGAHGVMVIVVGNEHSDTSSNPGRN